MLSDTAHEKTKNPLKKAMRRRNAKTVTFTAPTYVEASDYDYSTDEEGEVGYDTNDEDDGDHHEEETSEAGKPSGKVTISLEDKKSSLAPTTTTVAAVDEGVKLRANPTPSSLRHPDSAVFSDDKAETKKITLTPNLLRDDGDVAVGLKGRGSLDKEKGTGRGVDGVISPEPRGKDGKKMRKGGSVLGGLFKRRNRKGKNDEADLEDWLHSGQGSALDKQTSISSRESEDSQIDVKREKADAQKRQQEQQKTVAPSTIRKVEPETEVKEEVAVHGPTLQQKQSFEMQQSGSKPTAVYSPDKRTPSNSSRSSETERGPQQEKPTTLISPIETKPSEPSPREQQPLRQLSTDSANTPKPAYQRSAYQPYRVGAAPSPDQPTQSPQDRLSESPEQISYHDAADRPDLVDTTSSGDDTSSSPVESLPEIIERTASSSPTTATAAITRTWSDWSLRTYFEDDNDVRDMLIVVQQDRSGGGVVRKDHPDIGPLFEDASTRLADITKVFLFSPPRATSWARPFVGPEVFWRLQVGDWLLMVLVLGYSGWMGC